MEKFKGSWPLKTDMSNGVPEVTCGEVSHHLSVVKIIDVRRPEEFNNELGHIPGAIMKTLGQEFSDYLSHENKEQALVIVCRSGARSDRATREAVGLGFKTVANMLGGMIEWNELKFKVEKN